MSVLAVATRPTDGGADDRELVAAVRAGDDRAFELLYERYQPRIGAFVRGMVRDHGRAEDITQEVFIAALRRMREEREREILFKPWIYEIAKNRCIDAFRRSRNANEVSFDARDAVRADEHDRLAEPGATPDSAVEGKLAIDNLCGAFGSLSQVHHDILVLREFEGLSYREIGDRLGMSRPAVESTLFRARKRLSEEYEELVSGERCLRVQRLVDDDGARSPGLRDRRRMSRHLAHCQPCRRYAARAGVDLGAPARPAGAAARIAAFLPLPAFLRRRWGDEETATSPLLGHGGSVGQWSANVATMLDPGVASGWTKAVATAATVVVAGMGAGEAFTDRAAVDGFRDAGALPFLGAGRDAPAATASAPGASAPAKPARAAPDRAGPAARAPATAYEAQPAGGAHGHPAASAAPAPAPQPGADRNRGRPFDSGAGTRPATHPAATGRDTADIAQRGERVGQVLGAVGAGGRDPAAAAGSDASAPREDAPRLVEGVVAPLAGTMAGAAGQPAAASAGAPERDESAATALPGTVSATVPDTLATTTALHSLGG